MKKTCFMNQRKSYLFYRKELCSRKTFFDPIHREPTVRTLSDLNFIYDIRSINRSFVVVWEIPNIEVQEKNSDFTSDYESDIYRQKVELKKSDKDFGAKENKSFISGW
jgi:hypothetical protein